MAQNRLTFAKVCLAIVTFTLYVLLLVTVATCAMVAIGAYYNHQTCVYRIENKIITACNCLQTAKSDSNDKPAFRENAENTDKIIEFKELAKILAQTDNMTFLFTMFSVALVSAGAYLLERSFKNVKNAEGKFNKLKEETTGTEEKLNKLKEETTGTEEKLNKLKEETKNIESKTDTVRYQAEVVQTFFSQKPHIFTILPDLWKARGLSEKLKYIDPVDEYLRLYPSFKDSLCYIKSYIGPLGKNIAPLKPDFLIPQVGEILGNLMSVAPRFKQTVRPEIELCREILSLLQKLAAEE